MALRITSLVFYLETGILWAFILSTQNPQAGENMSIKRRGYGN